MPQHVATMIQLNKSGVNRSWEFLVELIETPRTGVCQLLSFSWFKKSFQRFGDAPRLAVRSFDRSSRCRRAAACCHFGCTRVTHCTYLYLMFDISMGTSMSPYPQTGSKFWITGDNHGRSWSSPTAGWSRDHSFRTQPEQWWLDDLISKAGCLNTTKSKVALHWEKRPMFTWVLHVMFLYMCSCSFMDAQ